jgi:hypothetical protein
VTFSDLSVMPRAQGHIWRGSKGRLMGRASIRTYRPRHSAHGDLYWRFVMWPVLLLSRITRLRHEPVDRRSVLDCDSVAPAHGIGSAPPATPLSALRTTWLSPRQDSVWLADEGSVRPEWASVPGSFFVLPSRRHGRFRKASRRRRG